MVTGEKYSIVLKEGGASDFTPNQIKNMDLDDILKIGEKGVSSVTRFTKETNKDAIKFYESRIVKEVSTKNTEKGLVRIGEDKFGNKLVYRSFSSTGGSILQ